MQLTPDRSLFSTSALVLLLGGAASAQTPIGGDLYDGSGGPLLSGQLYYATANVTVPPGRTLTIQDGAIVKFAGAALDVYGMLAVDGTPSSQVIFTSLADDSAGGDTNGDGPSVGVPGDWIGVLLRGGATFDGSHLLARYAGQNGFGAIHNAGADLTLHDSQLCNSAAAGLDLCSFDRPVLVEGCAFNDNLTYAVQGASIDSLLGLSNNTASGNLLGDVINVTDTSPGADTTIAAGNLINGVLVFANDATVPQGVTLTFGQGITLKLLEGKSLTLDGALRLQGQAWQPTVVTSIHDDFWGGDTYKDGPTVGSPGDWSGILVHAGALLDTTYAVIRYGGRASYAGIFSTGGQLDLNRTVVSESLSSGLALNGFSTPLSVRGCSFDDNGTWAIDGASIDSLSGFHNNTALRNAAGDALHVHDVIPDADVTIVSENCINGTLVCAESVDVPAGVTLSIRRNVKLKLPMAHFFAVHGTLRLLGEPGAPAVLTSLADDSCGGDTNGDGDSMGTPGDWYGVQVYPGGHVESHYAVIRYGGRGGFAGIYSDGGSLDLHRSEFLHSAGPGIDLNGQLAPVTIEKCLFENNGTFAIEGASIDALPGIKSGFAIDNQLGDFIRVVDTSPDGDVLITRENCLGGALVFTQSAVIPAGVQLTLDRGVVVKLMNAGGFSVHGTLNLLGTAFEPVVLTGFGDDRFAGDTNKDGPSLGQPGSWSGVTYEADAETSALEYSLLRFAGANGAWALVNGSPRVTLDSPRVEYSAAGGIQAFEHLGGARNWVAFGCATTGIELAGGMFELGHATAAGNGGIGIQAQPGHMGYVFNAIAWGNAAGNYDGFPAGTLWYSDGSAAHAGANGNLNVDPLFVDPTSGVADLRLQVLSPCVDAGFTTMGLLVAKDQRENSRLLDPKLTGAARPDMGAYEQATWEMRAWGAPHAGSVLKLRVDGPAGTSLYFAGLLDGGFFANPFGFVTAGVRTLNLLGVEPVGGVFRLRLPALPSLIGEELGIQTLTRPLGDPGVGHVTNLYRLRLLEPQEEVEYFTFEG